MFGVRIQVTAVSRLVPESPDPPSSRCRDRAIGKISMVAGYRQKPYCYPYGGAGTGAGGESNLLFRNREKGRICCMESFFQGQEEERTEKKKEREERGGKSGV